MKIKVLIILIAILLLGGIFVLRGENQNKTLLTPDLKQDNKLSPTPTVTPFPKIVIDQNSDLKEEVKKLTPPDFSPSYQSLKEEAQNF